MNVINGFDENMTDVLKSFYPKALMSELSLYMHRSLVDLHAAFPSSLYINIDNLMTLGQVVDCLIQISDTRNREAALNMRLGFRRSGGLRRNKDGSRSNKSRDYADNNVGSVGGKEVPTAFLSQMEAGIAAISLDPAGVVPINEGLLAGGESLSQSNSVTAVPAGLFVTQALSTIPGQPSVILLPPRQFLRCSIDGAGRSPLESDSIGKEVPEQGSQSAAALKEGLVTTRKSLDVGSGSGRNVTWEDGGLGGNGESAMTKDSAVASLQPSHSRTSYLQPSLMSSAYSNGCEDQPSSRDQSIGRRNALMLPTIMSEENLASFHQGSGMASFASRAGDSVASEQDGACRAVQVNSSQVLDPSSLGNSAVAHGLSDCITPGTDSNGSPQYLVHSAEGCGGTGGGSGLASTAAAAQVLDPASLGCDQFQSWSRPGGSASPAGVGGGVLNTFGEEEGGEEDTLEMFSRSLGGTAGTLRSLLQKNGSHSQAHRGMLSIAAMAMESARSSYSGESGLESPGGVDVRRGRASTEISTTDLMYRPDQVTSPGSGGPLTRAGSGHSIPIYPITSIAEQHTVTTFAAHQEFDANLCMTSNIASSTADLGLPEGVLMRSMGDSGNVGADPLFESLMQEATKKLGRDSHAGFSSAVASRRSSDYGSSDPLLMANGVSLHHHITPRDSSGGGGNVNIREQPNAVSAGGASADTHGSAAPPRHSETGPAWQPPHGRGDSVAVSSTASADIQQLSGTVALHISGQDFASLQDLSPFAPFASNLSPSSSVDEAYHAIQMPVLTSTMSVQPQLSGKKEGSSRSRLGREDLQHTAQQASDTPTTADALKVDEGERTSLLPGSGEAGKTSSSDVLGNAAGQLSGFAGFISKARRSLVRVNSDEFKSSSVFANVTAVVPHGLGTPSHVVPLGSALSYGDSSIKRISLSRAATATAAGGVLLDGMPVIPLADAEALDTVRQRMEAHLDSRLSSAFVEPICFPPTEEGYVSQVHWYSFQFAMDEMVDELEDAFLAVSAVLEKLPHPIR
ncbi:hypothetical protein CEUSTIGMA_g10580.t1 [Chlamydomonas eustigma]|uniref:Uncharacterized protein n=1 Tax=Chlamydomonas eustigma TaxID=1157962 RepID=A0A250XJA2_9CHLO|nr:hypothetical protein CEUSTIGMA_g10580.t1 [Chlamydomonas eustigma]|eukprot:GAX83154.1 hypothetical protein CEUSTIGMA_g10580.t1 [Chlamydomonas eustigma]